MPVQALAKSCREGAVRRGRPLVLHTAYRLSCVTQLPRRTGQQESTASKGRVDPCARVVKSDEGKCGPPWIRRSSRVTGQSLPHSALPAVEAWPRHSETRMPSSAADRADMTARLDQVAGPGRVKRWAGRIPLDLVWCAPVRTAGLGTWGRTCGVRPAGAGYRCCRWADQHLVDRDMPRPRDDVGDRVGDVAGLHPLPGLALDASSASGRLWLASSVAVAPGPTTETRRYCLATFWRRDSLNAPAPCLVSE
jgi:hypothetical protein